MNITRRNFLFGSAAAIAVAATPVGAVAEIVQPLNPVLTPIPSMVVGDYFLIAPPSLFKILREECEREGVRLFESELLPEDQIAHGFDIGNGDVAVFERGGLSRYDAVGFANGLWA